MKWPGAAVQGARGCCWPMLMNLDVLIEVLQVESQRAGSVLLEGKKVKLLRSAQDFGAGARPAGDHPGHFPTKLEITLGTSPTKLEPAGPGHFPPNWDQSKLHKRASVLVRNPSQVTKRP